MKRKVLCKTCNTLIAVGELLASQLDEFLKVTTKNDDQVMAIITP